MNSYSRQNRPASAAALALLLLLVVLIAGSALPAQAQIPSPKILYEFQEALTDATVPYGTIAQGRDGNLYGTGIARAANSNGGVFRITPTGAEVLLASFPSTWLNCAGLTLGADGNFYGSCNGGGPGPLTNGLIYRVTPTGVLTDIHDFTDTLGDANPNGAPVLGADGNLYGTTGHGNGAVYRITTAGVTRSFTA